MNQNEKSFIWAWKMAQLMIVIGIVLLLISAFFKNLSLVNSQPANQAASGKEAGAVKVYHFPKGVNLARFQLQNGEWSPWITLPPDTTWYLLDITGDGGYKICYFKGRCKVNQPGKYHYVPLIKEATFRIQPYENTELVVKIER